jgi:hypothetical protein
LKFDATVQELCKVFGPTLVVNKIIAAGRFLSRRGVNPATYFQPYRSSEVEVVLRPQVADAALLEFPYPDSWMQSDVTRSVPSIFKGIPGPIAFLPATSILAILLICCWLWGWWFWSLTY